MHLKRTLALCLTLSLLWGLPAAAAGTEAAPAPFADITDPAEAEAAELLRLMGIVNGTGDGLFSPQLTLSRAEFCKMAVEIMGNGDKVPAQMNRTIFKDVPSTHWARGYINVATQGTGSGDAAVPGIIRGDSTGCFRPNDPITFAEAVTILMRVLGYSDDTVGFGAQWYDGYMSTAAGTDLLDQLTLAPLDTITRGQTALLFYNLCFTQLRGSKDTYLVSLGGKEVDAGVVLDVDATAEDGTTGAFRTTVDTYKTRRVFDSALEGCEGKALLDADGALLAFRPKEGATAREVSISSAEATYLVAAGGERYTVEPDTVVYRDGKATTWKEVSPSLRSATAVKLHYAANGKLSYLYFPAADPEGITSMVARTVPNTGANPFAALTSGGTYTMFKNGVPATAADVRQYDVATYDAGTRTLRVSDLKLTGIYESVSPSPAAPITITLMGVEFDVLPGARNDLSAFQPGDKLTLLLTDEHQVAGAVSADVVKAQAVGLATITGEGSETTASVTLLQGGLTVSGSVSASTKDRCSNQLVTVTSSSAGRLSLSPLSGASPKSALDVSGRTLGDREVAENVAVYDRVKDGAIVEVKYQDLSLPTIERSRISFVSYDYAGRVSCLMLDDVTGDAYTYGYFSYLSAEREPVYGLVQATDASGNPMVDEAGDPVMVTDYNTIIGYETKEGSSPTLCVEQADERGEKTYSSRGKFIGSVRNRAPGGVAYTADGKVAATVSLTAVEKVRRADFDPDDMTVTVAGVTYPISASVQCYNKSAQSWLPMGKAGMEAARAYSDALTLYYDRAPGQGGKVRLIVIP